MADPAAGRVGAFLARRRVALGFVAAIVVIVVAQPTWVSWRMGLAVAVVGEALRIWAAGHLEKAREVTRSGPYRYLRHPLYAGSLLIALGVAIASRSIVVALVVSIYMGATIGAAIGMEEARLRAAFGSAYDDYRTARAAPMVRRFSARRAVRNREYRAAAGLTAGFALLALKIGALL